jgi:hypothetical protein
MMQLPKQQATTIYVPVIKNQQLLSIRKLMTAETTTKAETEQIMLPAPLLQHQPRLPHPHSQPQQLKKPSR